MKKMAIVIYAGFRIAYYIGVFDSAGDGRIIAL